MKKLNVYFFGEEKIHVSDAIWFYGGIALSVGITLFTMLSVS